MQRKSDLYVITKAKDLAKYVITITEKSPKKFRNSDRCGQSLVISPASRNPSAIDACKASKKRCNFCTAFVWVGRITAL